MRAIFSGFKMGGSFLNPPRRAGGKNATPVNPRGRYNQTVAVMSRKTEREMVRKAMDGDAAAVESLITAHQQSLYAFMLRMSGKPEVAEDIVQEAFVRVLKNLDRFDNRFRFSTWLFTIAKRLYVNAAQKRSPAFDSETVGAQGGNGSGPGRQSAEIETRANARDVLDAALADLNTQQREIILLFHQQNWSIQAVADYLDMPQGTVKSHLHRARMRMRRFIESHEVYHSRIEEVWT